MTTITDRQRFRDLLKTIPEWAWIIAGAGVIYTIISAIIFRFNPEIEPQFRLSLEPLIAAPLTIQVHVIAALSAFGIGTVLMFGPKGRGIHKPLGWAWVGAMAVTAISSFFITGLMGKWYSPIHAISAWTVLALPFGIAAIRRRKVKEHRKAMTGMFFGGIIIAGMFSFLPGRIMWTMFFAA
ncbi:hypothetical protein RYZ27_03810 [Hyphomonas sp. FCG-A18]|jgi:uncharacterized membrane protein|uniref:DUF2306 domain-containing protein n=1 Tax=Hyphomonas sp. FCG-A18 TaxID=3080019 RepID=UPI002B2CBC9E|nr:hypothetical protein RYZ27_03810 [Hyphomonas sp. FCG-A18]